nr:MAG TPA: hypothetical protein [Caudoviricetes sp.]
MLSYLFVRRAYLKSCSKMPASPVNTHGLTFLPFFREQTHIF